ncbi:inositol monophosphatase family protein [Effusibacillus pohliae]|uniref:inositol monophosphatase family protein n=1 Tax=Effusibacillus pohliae TaxID=232270 RepID=UPI00037114C2|nr:inositol monophosphatase [Effusibacillus pohliae]
MESILISVRDIAMEAAIVAGKITKERFGGSFAMSEKGEFGDLVTEVDHLAEREILRMIRAHFPDHQIRSEETGWSGVEGDWLWLVDPLDGTNNYALGIPLYGVSITLLYRQQPILGVIYDSHLEKLYIAEKDKGAVCNGLPLRVRAKDDVRKMTVGWIQGHGVQKHSEAMRLKQHLDGQFKRVLRLWAPSLLWCMLARGDLDGIVLYNSEGDDLYAGILMAREAGAAVIDFDGKPFSGINAEPYIIACHPDRGETFLQIVRTGLA